MYVYICIYVYIYIYIYIYIYTIIFIPSISQRDPRGEVREFNLPWRKNRPTNYFWTTFTPTNPARTHAAAASAASGNFWTVTGDVTTFTQVPLGCNYRQPILFTVCTCKCVCVCVCVCVCMCVYVCVCVFVLILFTARYRANAYEHKTHVCVCLCVCLKTVFICICTFYI